MEKNWKSYKESGLKTPENYFQDFDKNLLERIQLDQVLQESKGDFEVPADYFERANAQLLKIPQKRRVIFLNKPMLSALMAAAAIAILVFYVFKPGDTINAEGLSFNALNAYFQEEGIQDVLTSEDLKKIEEKSSLFDSYLVSDEAILDFIGQQVLVDEIDVQNIGE